MHKPEGCCYPDCFSCPLPDCMYEEEDLQKDKQALRMRERRKKYPELYREAERRRRERVEKMDPGHYARLQKELRRKKKAEAEKC